MATDGANAAIDEQMLYIENEEFGYAASNSLPNYAISPSITSVTISVASTSSGSILNFDSNTLSYNTLSFQDALPFQLKLSDQIFLLHVYSQ